MRPVSDAPGIRRRTGSGALADAHVRVAPRLFPEYGVTGTSSGFDQIKNAKHITD